MTPIEQHRIYNPLTKQWHTIKRYVVKIRGRILDLYTDDQMVDDEIYFVDARKIRLKKEKSWG